MFAAISALYLAQPSLSRKIRELEYEGAVQLMNRNARGIELTVVGKSFLDYARLAHAKKAVHSKTRNRLRSKWLNSNHLSV